jgi:intein-encoded DNA endonuclease-like protein
LLFPQHGPGLKHERRIELEPWQREITHAYPREFIRGLINSDGCRFTNPVRHGDRLYTYPRYLFSNVSEDIKRLFCEHLDLLGIAWRRLGAKNISVARCEAVAALDEFVGPKR